MAIVHKMDADQCLMCQCPIFLYEPESRMLIHAKVVREGTWQVSRNGHKVKDVSHGFLMTHYELICAMRKEPVSIPIDSDRYLRGRIMPDGKHIYVHNFVSRAHSSEFIPKRYYDRFVSKAIRKVNTYMKEVLA